MISLSSFCFLVTNSDLLGSGDGDGNANDSANSDDAGSDDNSDSNGELSEKYLKKCTF